MARNPELNYAAAVEARHWIQKLVDQGLEEFADVVKRLDKFLGLFS